MKIFLTGGTGFLGKAILNLLPNHTYCQYKRGDDVSSRLQTFCPDLIIHSAGEIYNENVMLQSNVILTKEILEYVKANNSTKMIYFGSSSEYGKKKEPMKETDVCDPQTLYAATKTAGTLLCQSYARSYDCDICTIRPFSVYGDFEPTHRLIPTLYKKITSYTKIDLIQGTHDFVYILDFIQLVDTIINSPRELTKGDIINAGTGKCYTNVEVAKIFATVLNKTVLYKSLNKYKEVDSPYWVCDPSYAKEKYNFEAKYTLFDGLSSYVKFLNS